MDYKNLKNGPIRETWNQKYPEADVDVMTGTFIHTTKYWFAQLTKNKSYTKDREKMK